MKKLLFLLLLTVASYGQTYQNPTFGTVKTMTAPTVTTTPHLGTVETNGTISKITPANLPVSTATQTAIDAKVGDFINDGATTIAPSQNAVYDALHNKLDGTSTALISGCTFVNNGAAFTINPGVFQIIDNSTIPYTKTTVNFLGVTNVTPLYFRTILYINSSGNVIQVNGATGDLTPLQRRDNLFISTFAYTGGAIVAPQFTPSIDYDASGRLFDLAETLGARNRDGNIIAINGANLQLNKGAGHTYRAGSNYATNKKVPDVTDDSAIIPIPGSPNLIGYRNGSGGWTYEAYTGSLTPTFWDNGSGTKATVTNNRFTIPRLYFFNGTNTFVIYLGQTEYNSLDAAKGAIYTETRTVDPATSLATHRASIPIEKGATSLSTQPTLFFIENHIDSRASSGVGGSGGAQNMQSGYNNSVTPQITTSTALGAVTIRNGSASDSNNIFQGQNIAGTTTFSITGNGMVTAADNLNLTNEGSLVLTGGGGVAFENDAIPNSDKPTITRKSGKLAFNSNLSTNPYALFDTSSITTSDKTFSFQNQSGTFALTNNPTSITASSLLSNGKITSGSSGGVDGGIILKRASDGLTVGLLDLNTTSSTLDINTAYSILRFYTESSESARLIQNRLLINKTSDDGVSELQVNGEITATTYTGGATLTGTPTAPTATAGTNTTQIATTAFVQTATRPYKSYTALLTQSGTSDPTVKVLENGLSGSVVWTRNSAGLYYGTLTGVFTADKTAVFTMKQTSGGASDVIKGAQRASSDIISVMTNTDGVLTDTSIEIRVYP